MVKLDLEKLGYMYRFTKKKDWKKGWFILRHGVLYKYRSHTVRLAALHAALEHLPLQLNAL